MIIFGGSAGEALAVRVANLTGAKLGKIDQKRFPDGEKYFRVLDDVKGDDVADGRMERTAWKSVDRAGREPLKPGDALFLKRGGRKRHQL